MISESLKSMVEAKWGKVVEVESVSGGDTSKAMRIKTERHDLFVKSNNSTNAHGLFATEIEGLNLLKNRGKVKVPEVLGMFTYDKTTFLFLRYEASVNPSIEHYIHLAEELIKLHSVEEKGAGLNNNNFIGQLHQSNKRTTSWAEFFVNERIKPQFVLAQSHGFFNDYVLRDVALRDYIAFLSDDELPVLLHGDLWSGNFLALANGKTLMIDPCPYFGHRLMDIAMTKLFGGFHPVFYEIYNAVFPAKSSDHELMELFQLYYLMVHLNMFGASYRTAVFNILSPFLERRIT